MIRTILSIAILTGVATTATLKADPSPKKKAQKQTAPSSKIPKLVQAPVLKEGWSLVNGVWTHSDGYQYVKGQVVRVGTQTHKTPPKPPTKAEMEAAMKKSGPKTEADVAAAKAAERERNLRVRPASQTGTHL